MLSCSSDPHVGCSAALDALLLEKVLKVEEQVLEYADLTRLRSIAFGSFYMNGYPDSHRERGQVSVDVGDAEAVEMVVWVCVPVSPGRGLVFCELGMIQECQFEAQAAVILAEIGRKAGAM